MKNRRKRKIKINARRKIKIQLLRRKKLYFRHHGRRKSTRSGKLRILAAWAASIFPFCFLVHQVPAVAVSFSLDSFTSSCVKYTMPTFCENAGNKREESSDDLSIISEMIKKTSAEEGNLSLSGEGSKLMNISLKSLDDGISDGFPPSNAGKAGLSLISSDGITEVTGIAGTTGNTGATGVAGTTRIAGNTSSLIVSDIQTDIKTPQVLIYHTHATESYLPVNSGNSHSKEKEGTVREAGETLVKVLSSKGIASVHDETLHDYPSYNKSYGRSLQTAKKMIEAYPDAEIIIDLHRDAASSNGNKASTVKINGETVASFSIVVGTENENAEELRQFANEIIKTANSLYPGFGTRVVEREYKFNEYLSDNYLLLEMGNNLNTIDQVNKSAEYFADVLEIVLKK